MEWHYFGSRLKKQNLVTNNQNLGLLVTRFFKLKMLFEQVALNNHRLH